MAEVYRATDSVLERPVAVKLLSERHARDSEVRCRFEREAMTAARLSGAPHVITVFDVGEHDGRPLIVMEYLDGGTVYDRLVRGRVSREQALEWLDQIAQALDRAHAHEVVHRDVKPANLLLDRDGFIQVSDFGIAFAAGLDTLTLPGTVLGTVGYLSPEQARGEPATPASDRYALGVLAFELLTGRRPFAADTPVSEALAHVSAPVPSAEQLEPELPAGVDRVLSRALAKDPDARPATCAELVAELREVLHSAPPPTLVDTGAPTSRMRVRTTRPRRRAGVVAGAVGLLATGLVLAALVGAARDDDGFRQAQARQPAAEAEIQAQTQPEKPPDAGEAPSAAPVDGTALNDAGFRRMQAGEYESALPALRQAVDALRGSGSLAEAYASYNFAFTRFALGRCDGVIGLLDRSEEIQGYRREIDELRSEWEETCGSSEATRVGDEDGPSKGKGNDRGRKKGHDD